MACCPTCGRRFQRKPMLTAPAQNAPLDVVFDYYKQTAPRLDLESYISYATAHQADYDADTRLLVELMGALHDRICALGDSARWSGEVWKLIDRFRAAAWAGAGGGSAGARRESDWYCAHCACYWHDDLTRCPVCRRKPGAAAPKPQTSKPLTLEPEAA